MTAGEILNTIFKNLPLLTVFLTMAGLIKLFTYYKLFNLNILEFIDIKEALILVVSNLAGYLIFFSVSISLIFLFSNYTFSNSLLYFLMSLFSIFLLANFLYRKKVYLYELILQLTLAWGLFLFIKEWIAKLAPLSTSENRILAMIFISLVIYSITNAVTEYIKVKSKKYFAKTKIEFKDYVLQSTNVCYYIGKTEKYIFLHNEQEKVTEVVPANDLKKIIFNFN